MNKLQNKISKILEEEIGYNVVEDCTNYNDSVLKLTELTKDIAVKFSLWTQSGDCEYQMNDYNEWFIYPNFENKIATEELFDKFIETL